MPSAPIRMSPRVVAPASPKRLVKRGGDAAFVLHEAEQPAAGADRILAEPLSHRIADDALQPAAMDRELRHS